MKAPFPLLGMIHIFYKAIAEAASIPARGASHLRFEIQ
jgi:hypothetical protein